MEGWNIASPIHAGTEMAGQRTGAGWPIDADLGMISSGKVFVPIEQGNLLNLGDLVGERGFEPPTPWSRTNN
jgi:hypothetical protein